MPQLAPLGGVGGGAESQPAHVGADFAHHRQAFCQRVLEGRLKFHEQGGVILQIDAFGFAQHLGVGGVDEFQRRRVEAAAANRDHRLDRRLDGWEGGDHRADVGHDRHQLERRFGDHAERALATDEQMQQIVAARLLDRARSDLDQPPVGQRDLHPQHVILARAELDRADSGGVIRQHPADGGVRAGIGREEQAVADEFGVQVLVADAGLHSHLKIVGVYLHDLVHLFQRQQNAAVDRDGVAFQPGADAPGRDRDARLVGELEHVGDAARRHWEDDYLGGARGVMRLIAGVQIEVGLGGADGVRAEQPAQLVDQVGGYVIKLHERSPSPNIRRRL